MDPWLIFAITVLVILSAFFSSSETALASLPPNTVERLIHEDRFHCLILWRDKPVQTLITILIGNNIANIASASFATVLAEQLFDHRGLAIAIGSMTLIILVAGEITPKSIARIHAVYLAPRLMRAILLFHYLFLPASALLIYFTGLISKSGKSGEHYSEKDLLFFIYSASHLGKIPKDRARLLTSVVSLKDVEVREIMVPKPRVASLDIAEGVEKAVSLFRDRGVSRLPVWREREDEILGILHAKDLLIRESSDLETLLHPVHYIPETKRVLDLRQDMQRDNFHFGIVVDEFGTYVGIVTLEDILEEIVGEIQDEHDMKPSAIFVRMPDGSYEMEGAIPLYLINRKFKMNIPLTGDYETLAGFIVSDQGNVPMPGFILTRDGWSFEVLDADQKRIKKVRIRSDMTDKRPPHE